MYDYMVSLGDVDWPSAAVATRIGDAHFRPRGDILLLAPSTTLEKLAHAAPSRAC